MKSKGYTLWLMPTGQAYQKFSNLIKKLAREYNAPVFRPHVTLLGDIIQSEDECIELTKQLVTGQMPFILCENTSQLCCGDERTKELVPHQNGAGYPAACSGEGFIIKLGEIGYEDFYFRTLFVKADKTEPLLVLHERAKQLFKINIPPYMPHLSLLYGNFPKAVKEEIIKEIGKDQSCQFEINSVHLVKGGAVEDWHIVGKFPLKP